MKKTFLVLLALICSVSLFASGAGEDDGYTFATNANWPPLEYVDENGDIVGFEIDLIKAMDGNGREKTDNRLLADNISGNTVDPHTEGECRPD